MFWIIKRDPGESQVSEIPRVYKVTVKTPEELADHIKACYAHTNQEILSVVNVSATDR